MRADGRVFEERLCFPHCIKLSQFQTTNFKTRTTGAINKRKKNRTKDNDKLCCLLGSTELVYLFVHKINLSHTWRSFFKLRDA